MQVTERRPNVKTQGTQVTERRPNVKHQGMQVTERRPNVKHQGTQVNEENKSGYYQLCKRKIFTYITIYYDKANMYVRHYNTQCFLYLIKKFSLLVNFLFKCTILKFDFIITDRKQFVEIPFDVEYMIQ